MTQKVEKEGQEEEEKFGGLGGAGMGQVEIASLLFCSAQFPDKVGLSSFTHIKPRGPNRSEWVRPEGVAEGKSKSA